MVLCLPWQVVIAHIVYVPAYTAFKKYVWKALRWWHWGADQVKATCPIYEVCRPDKIQAVGGNSYRRPGKTRQAVGRNSYRHLNRACMKDAALAVLGRQPDVVFWRLIHKGMRRARRFESTAVCVHSVTFLQTRMADGISSAWTCITGGLH